MITVPDILAAGFFAVEDFMTEVCAAIRTDDFVTEWAVIPETFSFFATLGKFELNQFPSILVNDGRVGVLDIVLLVFALVLFDGFREIVYREGLLAEGVTFVLFVFEDGLDSADGPDFLSGWSGNLFVC